MNELLLAGLIGGFGGAARASVGLSKALTNKKKIDLSYWVMTFLLGIIIGMFTSLVLGFDYRSSLLVGYAGTHLVEGVYKSVNKGIGFVRVR